MRTRNKLNARTVRTIVKPGMHSDGGGLYVRVRSTGTRSWVFVSNVGGRRREWGLGSLSDVSLALARARADEFRQQIVDGSVPLGLRAVRQSSSASNPVFGEFAFEYIAQMAKGLSNAKHAKQWQSTIERYAAPILDDPIEAIRTEQVVDLLRPIWTSKPETARRVRGRIERILDAAHVSGHRSPQNPARFKGHLELLLPMQPKGQRKHHAALPYRDLPKFMLELRSRSGTASTALEFLILTAARTNEVIGATWEEISPKDTQWDVPSERMKAREAHQVPLSRSAMKLLRKHRKRSPEKKGLVFLGRGGAGISNMAMASTLKRMGRSDITVHGFRSTFRDWAGEMTSYDRETIEMALAHTIGSKAEQAYRRLRALEKRRELMEEWAEFAGNR